MAKRTGSATSTRQSKVKKKCASFKIEWLSEYLQTEEQMVKLGEIFSFSSEKALQNMQRSKSSKRGENVE